MGQFVTDLNVLVAYDDPVRSPFHTPTGWEWIDVDLNKGTHGAYLYLVFERSAEGRPVTGIRVLQDDEKPPAGYQKLPVDLNRGTPVHDKALFLAATRQEGAGRPIVDLTVTHWKDGSKVVPPKTGYTRVDTDLNEGAKGDFIYLDYLRATENAPSGSPATPDQEHA
ncbi:hypothetical protein ACFV84_37385 [Kitasatospora sp. NPDC059811]|uniref:hypothetical protein n=1 Tax=Streptomycetaceae TaxID=2062 RepID=UPI0007AF48A6|nr:hypothetical protein [Streptomyces sp. MJM8645]